MDKSGLVTRSLIAKKNYAVLLFVFLALPVMSHAGGLGIAAIVALSGLLGLIGFRPPHPKNIISSLPAAIWVLMALLLWGVISSFWSPYQSSDTLSNAEKMMLGVPLYLGCAAIIHAQHKYGNKWLQRILIFGTLGSAALVLADVLSGYKFTLMMDPLSDGEDPERRRGDIMQNLGHAVSVLTLLLAPVAVLMWQKGGLGKLGAVALLALVMACGLASGMNSSVIAVVLALAFMGLALRWPKFAVRLGFFGAAASVLFAPVLAFLAGTLGPQNRAALPFSWEERVSTWGYMYDKILEKPWFGHGFDAVRTFNDTHTIRGFEGRALVSLHPHNAGMHIWAELGLVGVLLACFALFLAARRLTGTNGLAKPQLVALSGLLLSAIVMAGFSYGVWQDWWWASIIFTGAVITFIKPSTP